MSEQSLVVIKLLTSEVVLAYLVEDDAESLHVAEPLKVIQTPTPTNNPGEFVTVHVPVLFNPFGMSDKTTIPKRQIVFYELADYYYHVFHETCFSALWDAEISKQEMVLKYYNGEDEAELEYNKEDHGEPIVSEGLSDSAIERLITDMAEEVDEGEDWAYTNTPHNKTIH